MDVLAAPPSIPSVSHIPTESRTVIIPTHGAASEHRTPRMSRAMAPHSSWPVPSYQDPPQPAPLPAPSMSKPYHEAPHQRHLMRMPKMFYDIKPRLSPHMVSASVRQRQF